MSWKSPPRLHNTSHSGASRKSAGTYDVVRKNVPGTKTRNVYLFIWKRVLKGAFFSYAFFQH